MDNTDGQQRTQQHYHWLEKNGFDTTKGERETALTVEAQLHNNIYVENNIKVKQNQPRKQYCSYDQNTYSSSLQY